MAKKSANTLTSAVSKSVKTAWQALGRIDYGRKSSEQGNLQFRRSLYFVKNMKRGESITTQSVRSIRPGNGLSPKELFNVIGKKVKSDIEFGTPVHYDVIY